MKYDLGVVVGKFLPPHLGHKLLIDTALSQCERVAVIVCEKPNDPIPGPLRAEWLREIHPTANVFAIDDRYDSQDSEEWARNTVHWLGRTPAVVFTSEDYGDRYAEAMGSVHVLVDKARHTIPCSGTAIRQDPYANWDFLEPPVRAWYAKRICILGAESSGTTTLARALAEHFHTVWVPEYGREYSAAKRGRGETEWTSDEFLAIATEQNRREDALARQSNRLLICDTNAFATILWHRRYMGTDDARVTSLASHRHYDLYLLTGAEIPFVQDGLRDGEPIRHAMHEWFVTALSRQTVPWELLSGPHEQRLEKAITAISTLFG